MLGLLAGCGDDNPATTDEEDLRTRFGLETLGPIPYPADNLHREERIALGKFLFFDPILGGEKDVACGTCHHPNFAFADQRQFEAGTSGLGFGPARSVSVSAVTGDPISLEPRNTPTIFNTAFNADESGSATHEGFQFWDGRVRGLEVQATKPLTSRVAMRGDAYPGTEAEASTAALDSVLARLQEIPEYEALLDVIPGDDTGREEHTLAPADRCPFRTPTLRNVGLTPPFMHDGVFETLEEVVRFYNDGALPRHPGVPTDMLDPVLRDPLGLADGEIDALVAFLHALTDAGTALDPFLPRVPERVPSGLTPVFGLGAPQEFDFVPSESVSFGLRGLTRTMLVAESSLGHTR